MTTAQQTQVQAPIELVVAAARAKFDDVVQVTLTEDLDYANFYFVACKRATCHNPNRPYMYIIGRYDKLGDYAGHISFHTGHYDLTIDELYKHIGKVVGVGV